MHINALSFIKLVALHENICKAKPGRQSLVTCSWSGLTPENHHSLDLPTAKNKTRHSKTRMPIGNCSPKYVRWQAVADLPLDSTFFQHFCATVFSKTSLPLFPNTCVEQSCSLLEHRIPRTPPLPPANNSLFDPPQIEKAKNDARAPSLKLKLRKLQLGDPSLLRTTLLYTPSSITLFTSNSNSLVQYFSATLLSDAF